MLCLPSRSDSLAKNTAVSKFPLIFSFTPFAPPRGCMRGCPKDAPSRHLSNAGQNFPIGFETKELWLKQFWHWFFYEIIVLDVRLSVCRKLFWTLQIEISLWRNNQHCYRLWCGHWKWYVIASGICWPSTGKYVPFLISLLRWPDVRIFSVL